MKTDPTTQRLVLVGAGNVATALAVPLAKATNLVAQADRTPVKAVHTPAVTLDKVRDIHPDIVIISVADSAVDAVVQAIGHLEGEPLCLLTSGTVSMEALLPLSPRVGVLYPLQTFTAGFDVDIGGVPFFTETSRPEDLAVVDGLASAIGAQAYHADEDNRRNLHIAGVLSNNFVNILLEKTQQVLADSGYPLDVVRPLVEATVHKAFAIGPHKAQTGPARRGDTAVMQSQLERVAADLKPAFQALNNLICQSHEQD